MAQNIRKRPLCEDNANTNEPPTNCSKKLKFTFTTKSGSSDKENDKSTGFMPRGLVNESNTCYLNSIIQVLFHLHPFRDAVFSFIHRHPTQTLSVVEALQWLFCDLEEGMADRDVVTTNRLTKALGWTSINRGIQQDIHEFMQTLFNCLEKELNCEEFHCLASMFTGRLKREITCDEVGYKSAKFEQVRGLALPTISFMNIERSLKDIFKPEEIQMTIDGHGRQTVDMTVELIECPKVLPLTLYRLKYDPVEQAVVKVTDYFEYKEKLELNGYTYRLHSAVVHEGTGESGHYYCYISPVCNSQQWYMFNDAEVCRSDSLSAVRENYGMKTHPRGPTAYLLTYIREDCQEFFMPYKAGIPQMLRDKINDVRETETAKLKRIQSAHLYTNVSVVHWAMLKSYDGYDVCDRLKMDALHKEGEGYHTEQLGNIRVLKSASMSEMMSLLDPSLTENNTRLWSFTDREAVDGWQTHRPDKLIQNWNKSVLEISQMCPLYIYIEKLTTLYHPSVLSENELSIFVKTYDPRIKSLSLELHLIVSLDMSIGDFKSTVFKLANIKGNDTNAVVYQELCSMCTECVLCEDATELCEALGGHVLRHGIILIVEIIGQLTDTVETIPARMLDSREWKEWKGRSTEHQIGTETSGAADYMRMLGNRVIVSWYNKGRKYLPSHDCDFTIELRLDTKLTDVIGRLANQLGCGLRNLQVYEARRNEGYPQIQLHPVYDSSSALYLQDLLYTQVQHSPLWRHSAVLYYQQLAMSIEELDLRHTISCNYMANDLMSSQLVILHPLKYIKEGSQLCSADRQLLTMCTATQPHASGVQLSDASVIQNELSTELSAGSSGSMEHGVVSNSLSSTESRQLLTVNNPLSTAIPRDVENTSSVFRGEKNKPDCEEEKLTTLSHLLALASEQLQPARLLRLLSVSSRRVLKIYKPHHLISSIPTDNLRLEEIPECEEDVETEFSEVLASVSIDSTYLAKRGVTTNPFLMVIDRSEKGEEIQSNICEKLRIKDIWREKIEIKLIVPGETPVSLTNRRLSVREWANLAYDDNSGSYGGCNYIKISDCSRWDTDDTIFM